MGFNRYVSNDVVVPQDIIICPANTVITLIGVTVSNISGTLTTATIRAAGANILKNVEIEKGSAIVPVGGEQKIVLLAGDTLTVSADYAVDVIASVLEQTI